MTGKRPFPVWGIIAMILTPLAPLFGSIAVGVAEAMVDKPYGVIVNYFPSVARAGVLVMLATVGVGVVAGVISLLKEERPRALAMLAVVTQLVVIAAFRSAQYYKLGYDQDRGAEPPAGYIAIAEGLTAASAGAPMETAVRMFSAPSLPARCQYASLIARLTAVNEVELRVDEPFPLSTLGVVAFDGFGRVVPSTPVVIEVEPVSPPVLYFFPDRLADGPTANTAGFFLMKVRSLCAGVNAEVMIKARAVRD